MIFYFSGTGNSKYVAVKIGEEYHGKLVDISEAVKNNEFEYKVDEEEKIFFIFPVYFGSVPKKVRTFIGNVTFNVTNPIICGIATYGSTSLGVDKIFRREFKRRGIKTRAFYCVQMVDNYILMLNVPLREEQIMIQRRADKEICLIIDSINFNFRKQKTSPVGYGLLSKIGDSIYRSSAKTKKFRVDDTCIGCDLCQRICPDRVIKMKDGKPMWIEKTCNHCLGCINRCPKNAIQYGKKTEKRGRFVNQILK